MANKPAIVSFEEAKSLVTKKDPATKNYALQQFMYRIKDPRASLKFYLGALGMTLVDKIDIAPMKFTVYFVGYVDEKAVPSDPEKRHAWMLLQNGLIELTHNWGTENDPNFSYHDGNSEPRGFGHIGIRVPNLEEACSRMEKMNVVFQKKPSEGTMKTIAFIKDPDGYWVELLTKDLPKV